MMKNITLENQTRTLAVNKSKLPDLSVCARRTIRKPILKARERRKKRIEKCVVYVRSHSSEKEKREKLNIFKTCLEIAWRTCFGMKMYKFAKLDILSWKASSLVPF
jgi:hypothetical protein